MALTVHFEDLTIEDGLANDGGLLGGTAALRRPLIDGADVTSPVSWSVTIRHWAMTVTRGIPQDGGGGSDAKGGIYLIAGTLPLSTHDRDKRGGNGGEGELDLSGMRGRVAKIWRARRAGENANDPNEPVGPARWWGRRRSW